MNKSLITVVVCLVGLATEARVIEPAQLPPSAHLDTEVVTNVPVSMANVALSSYRLELDFTPSASNCVEVAFGRDSDGDGALGLTERGFCVGWDCGEWKLACRGGDFARPCAEGVIGNTNGIVFEVGGKGKGFDQIKDIPNSYVVNDEVEVGFGNKIPLWLFGFLY